MTPERSIGFLWLAWLVTWFAAALWSDRAAKRPAVGREIVYRAVTIVGVLLVFGFGDPGTMLRTEWWRPGPLVAWLCVGAAVCGLLFTWWARIHLGRLWSSGVTRKSDHHVVDTGPYGIVRHPIYTGVITAILATAGLRGSAGAWLGAAVMIAGFSIKARLEEEFLRKELGADAYEAYARRVPMLVPWL